MNKFTLLCLLSVTNVEGLRVKSKLASKIRDEPVQMQTNTQGSYQMPPYHGAPNMTTSYDNNMGNSYNYSY